MTRLLITSVSAFMLFGIVAAHAEPQTVEVYKAENCNCCSKWVEHLNRQGFAANAQSIAYNKLAAMKQAAGLKPEMRSCHTAKVGGYVIEGHVPASDIKRLLKEKPDAVGLTVPGMPIGSPGMEMGDRKDRYDVLLVKRDGTPEVFAKH